MIERARREHEHGGYPEGRRADEVAQRATPARLEDEQDEANRGEEGTGEVEPAVHGLARAAGPVAVIRGCVGGQHVRG
jgi:hypothetical protein